MSDIREIAGALLDDARQDLRFTVRSPGVGAVLAFVAIAASDAPAWRASRVSPSRSLQAE